jgi:Putative peptidoglycan binding domain
MKKLITILISCSLALAGAALAQQPVEQQSPSKNKHAPDKAHATQAQPKPNAAKHEASAATQQHGATKEHPATNEPGAMKEHGTTHEHGATNQAGAEHGQKVPENHESATGPKSDVSGRAAGAQTPTARQQRVEERRKARGGVATAKTSTNPSAPNAAAAGAAGAATGQQNAKANAGAKAKKPDPQQVQQIKSQHANFRAQPKPQQVPAVSYNQNYRIQGSEQWQGPRYEVFRSYHPEWHDQGWYQSRYNRVELIGGGYYFWNNGYWYPAWGYSPSAQYYAYDGPIYVGQRAEPPDKVIADVQAVLQQMGYYRGEVDGLLGPLTREALAAYQADQGLTTTAAIDEPTLDSLGMS